MPFNAPTSLDPSGLDDIPDLGPVSTAAVVDCFPASTLAGSNTIAGQSLNRSHTTATRADLLMATGRPSLTASAHPASPNNTSTRSLVDEVPDLRPIPTATVDSSSTPMSGPDLASDDATSGGSFLRPKLLRREINLRIILSRTSLVQRNLRVNDWQEINPIRFVHRGEGS